MPPPSILPADADRDALALLDLEIERLPAKYRLRVVLCELEGHGRKEAAAQLGIPAGTLSSRLAYARRVLAFTSDVRNGRRWGRASCCSPVLATPTISC